MFSGSDCWLLLILAWSSAVQLAGGEAAVIKRGDVWINEIGATQTDRLVQWPANPSWLSELGGESAPLGSAFLQPSLAATGPLAWAEIDFDDAGWKRGPGGLGYDDGDDATDLLAEMKDIATSLYIRQKFTLTDSSLALSSALTFLVDYDDGFVAYLNGIEIARDGVPDVEVVTYNSIATGNREAGNAVTFPVPSGLLHPGENVLAILVLNRLASSSDLSIIADLTVNTDASMLVRHEEEWRYFVGVWDPVLVVSGHKGPRSLETPKVGWGAPWHSPRFDDNVWAKVSGSFKGIATSAFYGRHTFNLTAEQVQAGDLEVVLEYAGGVVVYLNGVEVVRRNLGEPGTYVTRSQQGHTFFSTSAGEIYGLGPASSHLRPGLNTLAVELRQMPLANPVRGVTLGVDLRLAGSPPVDLVTRAASWRAYYGPDEPSGALHDFSGEIADWIELYNAGADVVDMSGWALTNDSDRPDKWRFPAGVVLQPGACLLVQESPLNEMAGGVLYLDIKLAGSGDYLALFDSTLQAVCEILPGFPAQSPHYSWGRLAESDVFGYLDPPSPGQVNAQGDSRLAWTCVGFDDAAWNTGVGGLGFGDDDDATVLEAEMFGVTPSLYLRSDFVVDWNLLSRSGALALTMDYDDGFIVFLNGREVSRDNMGLGGAFFAYNQPSSGNHEAGQPVTYAIGAAVDLLREGQNVLAVQVHNQSTDNQDLTIKADLDIVSGGKSLRLVNHEDAWRYFVGTMEPVMGKGDPAIAHVVAADVYDALLAPPLFMPERGFFDAPISVTLTAPDVGATIRYTIDGSDPTELNGFDYGQVPVAVEGNVVLRARAFRAGALPSAVATQTYFIAMDPVLKSLPSISLAGDAGRSFFSPHGVTAIVGGRYDGNGHWYAVGPDDYNLPMETGDALERPVSFEMLYPWTGESLQADCGVRFSGSQWTRKGYVMGAKASLRLYFRDDYGPAWLKHPIMGDMGVEEYKRLTLRAGRNDWANPFVRDELMRRLYLDMGWRAPRGTFANVFINGVFQGFYNPVERPDKYFFQSWSGETDAEWDVIHNGDLQDGNLDKYNEMIRILTEADMANPADFAAVSEILDIENTIDYYLLNTFAATNDWGSNNWGISREQSEGAWFRFYVWDAEQGFTRSRENSNVFADVLHDNNHPEKAVAYIYGKLHSSAEYRLLFADHIQRHLLGQGGVLTLPHIQSRFEELQNVMQPMVEHLYWAFDTNLVDAWVPGRYPVALQQYIDEGLWPGPDGLQPPVVSETKEDSAMTLSLLNPSGRGTLYYTLDGSDPRVSGLGLPASGAMVYSFPFRLDTSAWVRVRVREGGEWSPMVEKFIKVPAEPGSVIISEFLANSNGNDDGKEWIEVFNTTRHSIALDGWSIVDMGGNSHVIPLGAAVLVAPHAHLVLGASADPLLNGGVSVDYAYGEDIRLGNSSDIISLRQGEVVVHWVGYGLDLPLSSESASWVPLAPERGKAIGMAGNYYGGAVAEWTYQTSPFGTNGDTGTPGEENDAVFLQPVVDWNLMIVTLNGKRLEPGDSILTPSGLVITGGGANDVLKIRLKKEETRFESIGSLETDGGFGKVYTDVSVGLLKAQGMVRSLTTKGAVIEEVRAQGLGKVKMTGYSDVFVLPEFAPYPTQGVFLTSSLYGVGGGNGNLRANILLNGIVLGDLALPDQDVGTIRIASKLYRGEEKHRTLAYASLGVPAGHSRLFVSTLKRVSTSGAAIFSDLLDANSIGKISTRGMAFGAEVPMVISGDILCDTIRTGFCKLRIVATGGSIAPAWISCGGPIQIIRAKAKKMKGEVYGGFLGAIDNGAAGLAASISETRTHIFSGSLYVPDVASLNRPAPIPPINPQIAVSADIVELSGERGVRALIQAGTSEEGQPSFSGAIDMISVQPAAFGIRGKAYARPGSKATRLKGDAPTAAEFEFVYQ